MHTPRTKDPKGKSKQVPTPAPTLLSDRGYSPVGAYTDEADSSTEDLLIGPYLNADSPSPIAVHLPTRHIAAVDYESEDESAYFTPEETSVPPEQAVKERGEHFSDCSHRMVQSRVSTPSIPVPEKGWNNPPQATDRQWESHELDAIRTTSPTGQSSTVSIPWEEILISDIPRDIYETSDTGGIRCLTCAKWFGSFSSFKRHYEESRIHQEQSTSNYQPETGKNSVNGPPPLIRVPSEDFVPSIGSLTSDFDARSHISHSTSRSTNRQQNRYSCKPCGQVFGDVTAFHNHMSAAVNAHPYYCRGCLIEHPDSEALQAVSAFTAISGVQVAPM